MKTHRNIGLFLAMALSIVLPVSAQASAAANSFEIAGGAGVGKSVYSTVLSQLASVCKAGEMPLKELVTNGGLDNLELMKANKVDAAILPSDLLFAAKLKNPASVENIKTVVTLHQEAVHLIARSDVKTEGGFGIGALRAGGKDVAFNTAESLKGRKVGAAGGSVVSAEIVNQLLGFGWTVTSFENNDKLTAALESGAVDGAVYSAGIGSPTVAGIKGKFKLLALRGNERTSTVYTPKTIEYANLGGGASVDTLVAPAVLVTRTFSSKKMLGRLADLRQCFNDNVDELKDTKGTHVAWQSMEAGVASKWPMHNLPASSAAVTIDQPAAEAAPAKPAKRK